MSDRKMLFTAQRETFIARVLISKTKEAGIDCEFIPCEVNEISSSIGDLSLITLYMDDGVRPREDVIHYLSDSLAEKGGSIILVGDKENVGFVCDRIPSNIIYKTFVRPVDNDAYVNDVKVFFEKIESGEFKKSILIVDDDPQYLTLVRQWLAYDYRVSLASSGIQAIKFLGKNRVDLILLDHEMPLTSGPQVLEMLRSEEETKNIPVMFLTGKGDKQSVTQVLSLHPEGYFLKSIKREELLAELKKYFTLHNNN